MAHKSQIFVDQTSQITIFLWFSCGFPIPWFSYDFPMILMSVLPTEHRNGLPGRWTTRQLGVVSGASPVLPVLLQKTGDFHGISMGICNTWWLIPLSKWVITPVINGISRVNPLITGVITHLLSGMSHQVYINIHLFIYLFMYVFIFTY